MQVGPACDTQAGHVVRGRGREASRSRGRVSCPLRRVSGVVSRCRRLSQRQPETETHSPPCAPGFIPTSHTPFLSPPSLSSVASLPPSSLSQSHLPRAPNPSGTRPYPSSRRWGGRSGVGTDQRRQIRAPRRPVGGSSSATVLFGRIGARRSRDSR